jgi:hypothetical protein
MIASSALCQDVRYNFDKTTDFSRFKTYRWVTIKDAQKLDDIMDKQVKDSIDSALAAKGVSKVDGDNANLFIGYQVAVSSEKNIRSLILEARARDMVQAGMAEDGMAQEEV